MIRNKNFVDEQTLKTLKEVDGLLVLEEYLLNKGTDRYRNSKVVALKDLQWQALFTYGLKVNATNKAFVMASLEKFYHRNLMFVDEGWKQGGCKIPKHILEKVDAIHAQYKTPDNLQFYED